MTAAGVPLNWRSSSDRSMIFVFGSNLAGRHGAGAAKHAYRFREAKYGVGEGRTGECYAIPTKDQHLRVLPLWAIEKAVLSFLAYAARHPELRFQVTGIGTGHAGYTPGDIGPMFRHAPPNCVLCPEFAPFRKDEGPALSHRAL